MFTNNSFMKVNIFAFSLCLLPTSAFAQSIKFNPDAPLYIEYKSSDASLTDVTVQIEDAKSSSKLRLALQAKPESISTYYGYLWLQLGKKITNEVIIKKSKTKLLNGWITQQDDIQALFLFDDETAMTEFKKKAALAKAPLTDTKNLPALTPPSKPVVMKVVPKPTSKAIEINNSELNEIQKYSKLMAAYAAFTPEQKKLNDERAEQLAQSALKQYQLKNYKMAESQFSESLKLNPSVSINRYYLGICYYQTKQYERSLALLSLSEGAEYNYAEYKYYSGLNNLKLKNYPQALDNLGDAKEEGDPDYSGPAAFFSGYVLFQKADYAGARQNFEFTLDQSKDPKMDRESESMLEKIDLIEGYKNQMKQPFKYSLFVGFGYDSDVLNIAAENAATSLAAYRFSYGTSLNYKFFYDYKKDFSIDVNAVDYYSLDSKFKSEVTVQSADPLLFSVGLPYHYRFEYGPRIYTVGFLPNYQMLYMSLDGGSRTKILDTTVIGTDLNFSVSATYFSRLYLEYAMDKSGITPTTITDDLTAKRITLNTTQTFAPVSTDKKTYLVDLGYVLNNADGDDNDYNKFTAALSFIHLGFFDSMNTARIDFTRTTYPLTVTNRLDTVGTLTLGLTKDLNKKLNIGFSALYTMSTSNDDTYKYNKFGTQTMLTYSGAY